MRSGDSFGCSQSTGCSAVHCANPYSWNSRWARTIHWRHRDQTISPWCICHIWVAWRAWCQGCSWNRQEAALNGDEQEHAVLSSSVRPCSADFSTAAWSNAVLAAASSWSSGKCIVFSGTCLAEVQRIAGLLCHYQLRCIERSKPVCNIRCCQAAQEANTCAMSEVFCDRYVRVSLESSDRECDRCQSFCADLCLLVNCTRK